MTLPKIDFWFDFASTYSHLSVMRIESLLQRQPITLEWKPFLLGPLFKELGWNDSPFNIYPLKGKHMWRDVERIAAKRGLSFKKPSQFPRSGLQAARVALVGLQEGWGGSFIRKTFEANFVEDLPIQEISVLKGILLSLKLDAKRICEQAQSSPLKEKLRQQTERAKSLEIFGAPSFIVNHELFWGDDRLEEAIEWGLKDLE